MEEFCGRNMDIDPWLGELPLPQVYTCREPMALLAKRMPGPFCMLPFCHTLEAETLGARIRFDGGCPRASQPALDSMEAVLELTMDFSLPRLTETLEAARLLEAGGETVMFQLSGPLTILNSLLPSEKIYRSLRREQDLFLTVCRKLGQDVLALAALAEQGGVRFFSYADPMGAADILGPRGSRLLTEGFTLPFLGEMDQRLMPETMVCLCPKTAAALGAEKRREHLLPREMTYGDGLLTMGGKLRFAGGQCIHAPGRKTDCIHEILVGE